MLALAACNKTKTDDTLKGKITGTWKKTKFATDDNLNGKIDKWEMNMADPASNYQITFADDMTGTENDGVDPVISFTWNIVGSDSVSINRFNKNTTVYHIESINSSVLDLATPTDLGLAWYEFEKQATSKK